MIPYCKFKGNASGLYSTDGTREIIEHKTGDYSKRAFKVNVGNGVLWACFAMSHSHTQTVKAPLSHVLWVESEHVSRQNRTLGFALCSICLSTCFSC